MNVRSKNLDFEDLSRLLEVIGELGSSLDLAVVLEQVALAARDLLDADTSTLSLLDESGDYLRVEAGAGIDAALAARLATPVGENLAGLVCATGAPLRCLDIDRDERTVMGAVCGDRVRSAVLVPLDHEGEVMGTLGVQSRRLRRFDDRDERILQLFADRGTVAIATARRYSVEHDQVARLRTMLDQVNDQNDALRRSREAHDRLSSAVVDGDGLAALPAALGELVDVPLAIVNQFGVRLDEADPEDESRERLWAACEGDPAFLRSLGRLRTSSRGGMRGDKATAGTWRLVPVVAAAGEAMGAIVVLDLAELGEADLTVLEQASRVIATELLRERSVAEVEARAHGDLIAALIAAEQSRPARDRAALLGYELAEELAVVAVSAVNATELPPPEVITSAGARAIAQVGLTGFGGTVEGTGVVILAAGDRSLGREAVGRWIDAFGDQLRRRAKGSEIHFGVSELPCPGGTLREGFIQAQQAMAMCRLARGRTVTYFADVQLVATLIDITNDDAIERYIGSTIGRLEEYDRRRRTHLAQTLETYLDCSCVARQAARELYLHPHSLRYRLCRIAEIQEIDLSDPMVRLSSHLALKLRAIVAPPG